MTSIWDVTIDTTNNGIVSIFRYFKNTFCTEFSVSEFNFFVNKKEPSGNSEMLENFQEADFDLDSGSKYSIYFNFNYDPSSDQGITPELFVTIFSNLNIESYTINIEIENHLDDLIQYYMIQNGYVIHKSQKLNDEIYRLCTLGKAQEYIIGQLKKETNIVGEATNHEPSHFSIENISDNWDRAFNSAMEKYPSIHMVEDMVKFDIFNSLIV